jgi:hypothetical protein
MLDGTSMMRTFKWVDRVAAATLNAFIQRG